jgi:hypothetical protein
MPSLLEMPPPLANTDSIRNTFRSVEEVLGAADILAHKSSLPVAALVTVSAEAGEEAYVTAEYFYHDEHFIVLRLSFGSVSAFVDTMVRYRGRFDILVLQAGSPAVRIELTERKQDWQRAEKVLWSTLAAIKQRHLLSVAYHFIMDTGARDLLFVGGNARQVTDLVPPSWCDRWAVFHTALNPSALNQIGISPVCQTQPASAPPSKFDVAVLLSVVSGADLQSVVQQTRAGGALIDCVDQTSEHRDLLDGLPLRVVPLALQKGITGELLNLLAVQIQQPAASAPMVSIPGRKANVPGTQAA